MADETIDEIPETTEELPAVTPRQLVDDVAEGARIYSELTGHFMAQFQFYGKTLQEWGRDMTVEIPDEMDEPTFRRVLLSLAVKNQKAHNYYALATSLSKAFGGGAEIKKSDLVTAIIGSYLKQNRKRPAGTIVERMADSYMKSTVSSRVAAAIVRDFWRQRLDLFEEQRRLLELVGMSLHVETKWSGTV